jgi:SWI/SNF-related matrix-associated actin-dependent regulator of chromatin subfamily A3
MGLGKTLSILALILATREEKATAGYSGATLISTFEFSLLSAGNLLGTQVAPLSVLSNWSTQLEEHITGDAGIKAHVYYGDGKNVSASFLKRQDVVITTYQSATADLPSTKTIQNPDGTESIQVAAVQSGLFAVRWKV